MKLKALGLMPVIALALFPLGTRAQTTTAQGKPAQRLRTTFTSPLKVVGFDGYFTVTPRNSNAVWTCAEGLPIEIDAGIPPQVVYTISPDGNVIVANANGGALKLDVPKAQYATAPSADQIDAAPMKALSTLGTAATLFGTGPNLPTTGFELLYSPVAGLTASVKDGTQTLGVFTVTPSKWQIGIFPLDDAQRQAEAEGATPPPTAKGDVSIVAGACKSSTVPPASSAKS